MTLLDRAKAIAGGIGTLTAWLGDGGEIVSQELAQKRTNVCLACPLNKTGPVITEAVAKAIKAQVELRNHLGLRTQGIKSLKTCKACSCYLPLKIWVPINRILPDEEERTKLHPSCWIISEATDP